MFQAQGVVLSESLARRGVRPNVHLVQRSDGSASVLPSLCMCSGRCWNLFDVDVVRVWGTCRGSSPGGAEPHQLRGLMSGGRPPVGSGCGITGVLAEPFGPNQVGRGSRQDRYMLLGPMLLYGSVPSEAWWAEPRIGSAASGPNLWGGSAEGAYRVAVRWIVALAEPRQSSIASEPNRGMAR